MKAARLHEPGKVLVLESVKDPRPSQTEVLIRVRACAICRTDLHVLDGELRNPALPLIPGHEVVGEVLAIGEDVTGLRAGDRVGVPWLGWTCGECSYCTSNRENLCPRAEFTGYTRDGGYAELICADARYVFPLPETYDDLHAAPLLCAGLIGYRAFRAVGEAQRLGFYGFGAAAHILAQIARHLGREVFAFTRTGDVAAQQFARELGVVWAGESSATPPVELDGAIIFAPVGALVPTALEHLRPGGTVVCAGIHMSDIPSFPYALLWQERSLRSVANLTRQDGIEFMQLAAQVPLHTEVEPFALNQVNRALEEFRSGRIRGAAVLVP